MKIAYTIFIETLIRFTYNLHTRRHDYKKYNDILKLTLTFYNEHELRTRETGIIISLFLIQFNQEAVKKTAGTVTPIPAELHAKII